MWVEISVLQVHHVKADARSFLLPEATLVLCHSSRPCFYRAVGLGLQVLKRKPLSIQSETRKLFMVKTGPHSSIRDESGIDQA